MNLDSFWIKNLDIFWTKIWAPFSKEVGGFFWYPEEDIIWILNRENLGSLLQQTGRFSRAKFRPKIFKFWIKNRAPLSKESGQILWFKNTVLPLHKIRKISHLNFEIKTDFLEEKNVAFDSFKVAGFSLKKPNHWIKF